jgi:hypothetical protein
METSFVAFAGREWHRAESTPWFAGNRWCELQGCLALSHDKTREPDEVRRLRISDDAGRFDKHSSKLLAIDYTYSP